MKIFLILIYSKYKWKKEKLIKKRINKRDNPGRKRILGGKRCLSCRR